MLRPRMASALVQDRGVGAWDDWFEALPLYTPCWCEENVYLLLASLTDYASLRPHLGPLEAYAVFVSNSERAVKLYHQKASRETREEERGWVIWDYHVVVAVRMGGEMCIVDRDSKLGLCVRLRDYVHATFYDHGSGEDVDQVARPFDSRFRVFTGVEFLDHFASDRSHMLYYPSDEDDDPTSSSPPNRVYEHPPPSYPPITGPQSLASGVTNNLFRIFLSMDSTGPGSLLLSPSSLLKRWS